MRHPCVPSNYHEEFGIRHKPVKSNLTHTMTRIFACCLRGLTLTVALLAIFGGSSISANEVEARELDVDGNVPAPPQTVVVRVSGELVERLFAQKIEHTQPFETFVLDAWCVGTAEVDGTTSIEFADAKIDQPLEIHMAGVIEVKSRVSLGKLNANATTLIPYRVSYSFRFDGIRFRQVDCKSIACPQSEIHCVESSKSRFRGQFVSRLASIVAPLFVAKYDAAAKPLVEKSINEGVVSAMSEILDRANELVRIDATVKLLMPTGRIESEITKTRSYLQARFSQHAADNVPPASDMKDSLVEIWVYPNQEGPKLSELQRRWESFATDIKNLNLSTLEPLIELARMIDMTTEGEWDRVRVGNTEQLDDLEPLGFGGHTR